jgi:predicted nucleic acid-binding protein
VKQRVYLETSIVSYLTARPSRDLIVAAHQEVTRQWWERRRLFELHVSEVVIQEAGGGEPALAAKRLDHLKGLPILPSTEEAREVTRGLLQAGILPHKVLTDMAHIAVATVHEMDVLLTWNCRHLANTVILGKVGRHLRERGYEVPIICTPDEMMGE